jgi:flagellar hook-basal body complex protein FliE
MSDPLGFISSPQSQPIRPGTGIGSPLAGGKAKTASGGVDFKAELLQQIEAVNRLQQDAEAAKAAGVAGEARIEDVMIATAKADTAFKMLLAVRNKLMDAYEDVKNLRV